MNVRSLPLYTQRMLALTVFGIALLLVWGIFIRPAADLFFASNDSTTMLLYAKYQKAMQEAPLLDEAVQQMRSDHIGTTFVEESGPEAAAAYLQSSVKKIVEKAGATVDSIEILPQDQRELPTPVRVRVQFVLALNRLTRLFKALDAVRPYGYVDNVTIKGVDSENSSEPENVTLSLNFSSYLAPEAP